MPHHPHQQARPWRQTWVGASLLAVAMLASANEAVIRKNLSERLPSLPRIDEVRPSAMPGLFEVRVNQSDIFYTDAQGNFLIQGVLIDSRTRANLTEQRVEQITRLAFKDLPLQDALTTVRGNGRQKIAVFSDPLCSFCKRLDRDLARLDDITIYTFLIPLLGPNSQTKSRNIWCARDRADAYNDWMLKGVAPANASCDTAALTRNLDLARKHGIRGTPTSFLADDTRVVGADFSRIQQGLSAAR